jgi:MSHA biogenesis protein MshL
LSAQGKTRVLSSPRVSTLNNQKAVIKAGSDEYFVTGVSSNTVVGTASATNRDVQLAPFFSGIALDVTPQIAESGEVIMHIHPSVSDVSEKIKQLTVAGVTDALPLAFSQTRESDSVVKAKSGQLIVIGGLMRTTRNLQDYRVPLLGDIPGLGNLFKSQRRQEVHTELVILLRPVVVDTDGQWSQLAADSIDRATKIDPKAGADVR